jgi:hypothetical protein
MDRCTPPGPRQRPHHGALVIADVHGRDDGRGLSKQIDAVRDNAAEPVAPRLRPSHRQVGNGLQGREQLDRDGELDRERGALPRGGARRC